MILLIINPVFRLNKTCKLAQNYKRENISGLSNTNMKYFNFSLSKFIQQMHHFTSINDQEQKKFSNQLIKSPQFFQIITKGKFNNHQKMSSFNQTHSIQGLQINTHSSNFRDIKGSVTSKNVTKDHHQNYNYRGLTTKSQQDPIPQQRIKQPPYSRIQIPIQRYQNHFNQSYTQPLKLKSAKNQKYQIIELIMSSFQRHQQTEQRQIRLDYYNSYYSFEKSTINQYINNIQEENILFFSFLKQNYKNVCYLIRKFRQSTLSPIRFMQALYFWICQEDNLKKLFFKYGDQHVLLGLYGFMISKNTKDPYFYIPQGQLQDKSAQMIKENIKTIMRQITISYQFFDIGKSKLKRRIDKFIGFVDQKLRFLPKIQLDIPVLQSIIIYIQNIICRGIEYLKDPRVIKGILIKLCDKYESFEMLRWQCKVLDIQKPIRYDSLMQYFQYLPHQDKQRTQNKQIQQKLQRIQ